MFIYIYIYLFIYILPYVFIYIYINMYICICMYVHRCVYTYINMFMYIHVYVCIDISRHESMYLRTCTTTHNYVCSLWCSHDIYRIFWFGVTAAASGTKEIRTIRTSTAHWHWLGILVGQWDGNQAATRHLFCTQLGHVHPQSYRHCTWQIHA